MMSTPSDSSCRAMRIFSGTDMENPGDCSPSLSVVSKMRMMSIGLYTLLRYRISSQNGKRVKFIILVSAIKSYYMAVEDYCCCLCQPFVRTQGFRTTGILLIARAHRIRLVTAYKNFVCHMRTSG